ncbi:hypothetical protein YC2023_090001 [Brassica napus]
MIVISTCKKTAEKDKYAFSISLDGNTVSVESIHSCLEELRTNSSFPSNQKIPRSINQIDETSKRRCVQEPYIFSPDRQTTTRRVARWPQNAGTERLRSDFVTLNDAIRRRETIKGTSS